MTSPRTGATATSKDGLDLCRAYFFPCMKERDKRGSARRVHALWHGKKKKLESRTFIHDRHIFKAQAIRSFHKR